MVVISRLYRSIFFVLCAAQGLMAGDAVEAYRSARNDVERFLALGNLQPEVIRGSVRRKLGDRLGKGAVAVRKNIQREMDALAKRIRSQQLGHNKNTELLRQQAQSIKQQLVTERKGCQEAKNAVTKTAQESVQARERLEKIAQEHAVAQKRATELELTVNRQGHDAIAQKEAHEKEIADLAAKVQEQHRLDTARAIKDAQERDVAQKRAEALEMTIKRQEQEVVRQKETHEKEITDAEAKAQEQHRLDAAQAAKAAQERDVAQKRAEELETAVKRQEQEAIRQKETHEKEVTDMASKAQEQHRLDTVRAIRDSQERDIAQKRANELEAAIKRQEQEAIRQKEAHEKEIADAAAKAQEQHRLDTTQAAKAAQERDVAQKRAEELETAIKRQEQEAIRQKEAHEKEITDAAAKAQEQHRLDTTQAAKAAQERDVAQKRAEELETAVKRQEQEAFHQKETHEKEVTDMAAKAQEQHRLDTVRAIRDAQERDIAQKRANELEAAIKRQEQEAVRQKETHEKEIADQRQAAAKIESDRAKLEAVITAKNKELSDLRQSAMRARMEEMFVKPGLIQQKLAAVQRPSSITDKARIGQLSSVVRAQKSAIEGLNQKINDLTRPTAHAELPGPAVFPAQAKLAAQKIPEPGMTQRVINKLSTMFEWFNPREARERLAAEPTAEPAAPVRGPIELPIGEPTTAFQESFEPTVSSPAGAAEPKMVISSSQPEADIAGLMFKQLAQEDPSAVTKLTGMLAEKVTTPESPMVSASTAARTAELARGLASAASVATGYLPG